MTTVPSIADLGPDEAISPGPSRVVLPLDIDGADPGGQSSTNPADVPQQHRSTFSVAVMLGQYAVMQGVVAATGVIRNKVVALRLGPAAFGEIIQLAAVTGLMATITSFGMSVSLSRNVARANNNADRQGYLSNANGLVFMLAVPGTLLMLAMLVTGDLLRIIGLVPSPDTTIAAGIFIIAIPIVCLETNYFAFLQGLLDVKGMASRRSIAVIAGTALTVPLIWLFGFLGGAVSYLLLTSLLAWLFALRCRSLGYRPLHFQLQRPIVALLASFGLVSLIAGFAQVLSDIAVRTALIAQYGTAANGVLQAPLVVSLTLKGIVLGSIGSLSLAAVSGSTRTEDMVRTIDQLLRVTVPLSSAVLGLLGLLGVPALFLLYSEAFTSGASLFVWLLPGDLLLTYAWVIAAPLLAVGDRSIWLANGLIQSAVTWSISVALLPSLGPTAVGIGFLAGVVVLLLLTGSTNRYRYRLHIPSVRHLELLVGIAIVTALAFVGANYVSSPPIMAAACLLWAAYTASHLRTFTRMRRGDSSASTS